MSPTNGNGNGNGDPERDGKGLKRKLLADQFEFGGKKDWKKSPKGGQTVLGSMFMTYKPVEETIPEKPDVIDFLFKTQELPANTCLALSENTAFEVTGRFEKRERATEAAPFGQWKQTVKGDYEHVIICPNIWEQYIKSFEIFNGVVKVFTNDESRNVPAWLQTFIYQMLNDEIKKKLMPEPWHPGRCIPGLAKSGWDFDSAADYKLYSDQVLGKESIRFRWIPPMAFFSQNDNYFAPGTTQRVLPWNELFPDNLKFRLQFQENQNLYFKKKPTNFNEYRFRLLNIEFKAELYRLNPTFKFPKTVYHYPATTKLMKVETIPAGLGVHKATIQSTLLPEILFIFALNKDVVGGTYSYSNNTDGSVFEQHNIDKITLAFAEKHFFYQEPNVGMINNNDIVRKIYNDWLNQPPFAIDVCKDKITLENINEGWSTTNYPHVWVNLRNSAGWGDKTRIVPFQEQNANLFEKPGKLDINFHFKQSASPANVTFFIYSCFTDENVTLDMRPKNNKLFGNTYVKLPQIS